MNASLPSKPSRYRPEIDGLRAFAVAAVIINHFNKDILPGGYLGVDVFFVISGYVITSSLFGRSSKDCKDFISGFYERRIKRLVPALSIFVLITSIAICLFNPSPRISLRTGLTSLFGLSNLYLLRRSTDYFAQTTELNVFTHTWSLGVEEQFYILFPFLVWFSGFGRQTKNGARNLFLIVGALTIASLAGFLYLYQTNQPAAYFLMPSRFWEMATGCLIFIGFQKQSSIEKFLEKVPPLLVLALMIGVMYLPISMASASTIAIVAFTSILIACLKKQTAAFNIFINPKVVYIGLISYSLYLWHWGVLSISRWTIGIYWWSVPFQIALILVLSVVSHRWIEIPLRKGKWPGKRWKTLVVGGGVLVSISGLLFAFQKQPKGTFYAGNNFRDAVNDDYSDHFKATREKCGQDTFSTANCFAPSTKGSDQTMLLLGDSHAGHLIPLIGDVYANQNIGVIISIPGYFPKIPHSNNQGRTFQKSLKMIEDSNSSFKKIITRLKADDIIILSSRWEHHLLEDQYNLQHKYVERKLFSESGDQITHTQAINLFKENLAEVAHLLQAKKINLVLFAPIPVFRGEENASPAWACTQEWFRPFKNKKCDSEYQEERVNILNRNALISGVFKELSNEHDNIFVYNAFNLLCPNGEVCKTTIEGQKIFRDDDHLSREGAKFLYEDFTTFLTERELIQSDQ